MPNLLNQSREAKEKRIFGIQVAYLTARIKLTSNPIG